MIDLHDLRARPDAYQAACDKKRITFDVAKFLHIDQEVREAKRRVEDLRAKQNRVSKEIVKLAGDEKTKKLAEMKEVATAVKVEEEQLRNLDQSWNRGLMMLPSIPLDSVPVGKDDSENVESRRWGTIREFTFEPKDHVTLAESLDILDIERGVKIAGARNYFLKGDGARLQHAVLQFAMDLLHKRGYTVMDVPHLVNYGAMEGTSYFPGGEEQAYHLDDRDGDTYLIGTSEVSVTSYHRDEILPIAALPKRYAGYSPCYRREAGTYGKDARGLYRIHQFYKIEQVVVCEASAEVSAAFHAELLGNAEAVLQALKLPYRVVDVCTGDMGRGQVYKNDIETWMPSRKGYGETHSCSTFYDFQARRLNMRYKNEKGDNIICHTLNNTCVASPRILIPILELYQNADGTVSVPDALIPYMGGQTVMKPSTVA
jgi:seryl-tRNA synthetase